MTDSIRPAEKRADRFLDLTFEVLADRFAQTVAARTDEVLIIHPDNTGRWAPWPAADMPVLPCAVHLAMGADFARWRSTSTVNRPRSTRKGQPRSSDRPASSTH